MDRSPAKLPEAGLEPRPAERPAPRHAQTSARGTPKPVELVLRVSDGASAATQSTSLVVYQSDKPLTTPVWWKPGIPPIPWRAWLDQGVGFLILWLVHLVGMNTVTKPQRRWSLGALEAEDASEDERDCRAALRRFAVYRTAVRLANLTAAVALGVLALGITTPELPTPTAESSLDLGSLLNLLPSPAGLWHHELISARKRDRRVLVRITKTDLDATYGFKRPTLGWSGRFRRYLIGTSRESIGNSGTRTPYSVAEQDSKECN